MSTKTYKIMLVVALIGLAVWSRFVPHPANFTALTAVALFGGALLPRRWGVIVPVGAMILSDLVLSVHALSFVVWSSFALVALLGRYLSQRRSLQRVVAVSLLSSTLFYVVTNAAVWLEGRMYSYTVSGLVECYMQALPFYRTMLVGDLVYAGVLFGGYALALRAGAFVRRQRSPRLDFVH